MSIRVVYSFNFNEDCHVISIRVVYSLNLIDKNEHSFVLLGYSNLDLLYHHKKWNYKGNS